MSADLITIFLSWILLSAFSLLSLPLLATVFGKFMPDAGWAFGRVTGWLMVAIPVWFLAHLGLPINTTVGIWIIYLFLLTGSSWFSRRRQKALLQIFKKAKALIITEEILFASGFVFLCLTRSFQPSINGLEKFMDVGLIISYLKSPVLPIADMWLSGHTFNYYTFGHFMGAIATQIMRQPIELSYNLLLGFLMGLTLIESFGVVTLLLKHLGKKIYVIFGGVVGALLVTFAGNTQHLWFFLGNGGFVGYWYPDATRFIHNTIHEFPAYSFIVSDLHAHVWSMVLVLLLIPLIFRWAETLLKKSAVDKSKLEKPVTWALIIGGFLGLIASTSTWDIMIYSVLLGAVGLIVLLKTQGQAFKQLVFSAIIILLGALLTMSPWLLNFTSISEGVRLVSERSPFWQLIVLWVGMWSFSGFGLMVAIKNWGVSKINTYWQVAVLVVLAWGLISLPEIIFFKDIYPTHPRANTMFKFTFQGFILMQLITGWFFAWILSLRIPNIHPQRLKLIVGKIVILFLTTVYIVAILIYPYFGYRDYYGFKIYSGLNGLNWLKLESPDDYAGIMWLNKNIAGRPVILEAVGESYTTFARVSTFTGLPTVLGWPVHEWLWRGSFDIPGQRTEEVKTIYTDPLGYLAQQKLAQYQVEYLFVGDKEREAYPNLNTVGLKKLGKVAFEQKRTFIIKLGEVSQNNAELIEFR